jgi:hypothetical protein
MKGLIIRDPWIDLILDNQKTWEVRGSNTKIRGRIALIKSGTGQIFGTVNLIGAREFKDGDYYEFYVKHRVERKDVTYANPWAWVFRDPDKFAKPIPYQHPQGAVIWINLKEGVIGA